MSPDMKIAGYMEKDKRTWKLLPLIMGAMLLWFGTLYAQTKAAGDYPHNAPDRASFAKRFIHRLEVEGRTGYIFPTNPFLKGENSLMRRMETAYAGHLKYSFQLRPHTAASQAYIGAYQGIGLGCFNFGNRQELGNPLAVYLFQGGSIARLSRRLSLNYEWNFGVSWGWKPYDEADNPLNKVIGSPANAYLNVNLYLNWALSPLLDFTLGVSGNHFSNGNTRYPNSGLNTTGCKIGLIYNFNRKADETAGLRTHPAVPPFPRHVSYDLTLFGSWRKKAVNVPGGQVPAPDTYPVFGFGLAPMYNFGYKFRAGVSLDGIYDGSANIRTCDDTEEFLMPRADKRLALGLSARGELVMPCFTVGIGLGANVLHGGGDMNTSYQILALKIDAWRNSYLHIGYSLSAFHAPNCLMLGIGYRFNNKRPILF